MGRVAAFFDIDHTVISGDSGMLLVRYLIRNGLMRRRDLLGPVYYTLLYRLNLLDINAVFRRYQERIKGQTHEQMQSLSGEWYAASVRPRIYRSMAQQIAEHRTAGHIVAFLSSATTYVAEPLAQELKVDHLLVNRLEMIDGRLTGEAVQPLCWGVGKKFWVRRFVDEHSINLAESYFYSDSIADLPVLSIVGNPRVVNPDRLLRRHARRNGWPILSAAMGEAAGETGKRS